MPSGTGKTITILSFMVSYLLHHQQQADGSNSRLRFIYCTRTVPEINKTLDELRRLMDYRTQQAGTQGFQLYY